MSWSEHSELQKAVHLLLLLFLWIQKLISLSWALYCYCLRYSTIDFKVSCRVNEIKRQWLLKGSDYTIPWSELQNYKRLFICCFCCFFELKNSYHWAERSTAIASGIQQLTSKFHAGWMKSSANDCLEYLTILSLDQNFRIAKVCSFVASAVSLNSKTHIIELSPLLLLPLVFNNWLQSFMQGEWNQAPMTA
jgi:hypothetical protein